METLEGGKITPFLRFIPFPAASAPTANPVWKYFQGKEDYVVVCYEFQHSSLTLN